ncbi:MAG: hypothetical protein ACM3XO_03570 [Bacteroidota bacterium]
MNYKSLLALDVLIGLIPAMIAYDKGHRFWKWWFFGAAMFIAAIPMAILLKPNRRSREINQVGPEGMKRCQYCQETIRAEAVVCQFCGQDLLHSPGLVEPAAVETVSAYLQIENTRMENILKIAILVAIVLLIIAMSLLMLTNLNY